MKKIRLVAIIVTVLAVLLGASALTAAAAGPTNVDLQHAQSINNQPFTIPAKGVLWFSFKYAGDRSTISVQLINGDTSHLLFDVWTPTQALDLANEHPIGRGTAMGVNCDTGRPAPNSSCRTPDTFWQGNFNSTGAGTYFVEVFNPNSNPVNTQLVVTGSGVTFGK